MTMETPNNDLNPEATQEVHEEIPVDEHQEGQSSAPEMLEDEGEPTMVAQPKPRKLLPVPVMEGDEEAQIQEKIEAIKQDIAARSRDERKLRKDLARDILAHAGRQRRGGGLKLLQDRVTEAQKDLESLAFVLTSLESDLAKATKKRLQREFYQKTGKQFSLKNKQFLDQSVTVKHSLNDLAVKMREVVYGISLLIGTKQESTQVLKTIARDKEFIGWNLDLLQFLTGTMMEGSEQNQLHIQSILNDQKSAIKDLDADSLRNQTEDLLMALQRLQEFNQGVLRTRDNADFIRGGPKYIPAAKPKELNVVPRSALLGPENPDRDAELAVRRRYEAQISFVLNMNDYAAIRKAHPEWSEGQIVEELKRGSKSQVDRIAGVFGAARVPKREPPNG